MTIWTQNSKNSTSWSDDSETVFDEFLLQENSDDLLQEGGDKIILDQSTPSGDSWTNITKT